ncbi:proton-coupled zinc antiporter SLC30A9, mitochondrial isoform X2 [Procambarus clarkii]|uniref:proton-coupled zinc antiporter SLC30A9, mitochondrial isoform X2 n=1 Tax=Procambarus clarkii TaxID=6728 RepID=UPI001E67630F|nr:zinc transporter 9-like isoform X2 [Procambarus clarkii]
MYPSSFKVLNFILRDTVHHGRRAVSSIGRPTLRIEQCRIGCSYSRYQQVRLVQLCHRLATLNQPPGTSTSSDGDGSATKKAVPDPPSPPSATSRFKEAVIKVIPRKKERVKFDTSHPSTERNFITAIRAMSEFLLKPSDLENLRKTKRRSPFENEPPITVYWRKDVEAKAIQVWGSVEALDRERVKREKEVRQYQQNIFNIKKILKEYRRDQRTASNPVQSVGMDSSSRVVWAAVIINGANFVMKLGAWAFTGSHCLFAEALHSLADVTNQLILAYGIHKSKQSADLIHPYGYTTMRYVSSLISGAMIFCVGAGLSIQHGISGLFGPSEVLPLYWAFYILGGSLITEGGTLLMAVHAIKKGANDQQMTFAEYVFRGQDPSVNVVLLEDMAAVMGVAVAMGCMGLTSVTGSHIPDALGSCLIGGILAAVSGFIVYTNSAALVGKSIPQHRIEKINAELERDVLIRAIYDVKGIDMGSGLVRYKAEVDFDGRELTRGYLDTQDLEVLLNEMQSLKTIDEVEAFMLKHGENIVDSLGAEVDRIETILKKSHPEIRHCDLEIL